MSKFIATVGYVKIILNDAKAAAAFIDLFDGAMRFDTNYLGEPGKDFRAVHVVETAGGIGIETAPDDLVIMTKAEYAAAVEADKQARAAPPKPPTAEDTRVLAAPSDDPIAIKAIPPMREFVDEWRHEEAKGTE